MERQKIQNPGNPVLQWLSGAFCGAITLFVVHHTQAAVTNCAACEAAAAKKPATLSVSGITLANNFKAVLAASNSTNSFGSSGFPQPKTLAQLRASGDDATPYQDNPDWVAASNAAMMGDAGFQYNPYSGSLQLVASDGSIVPDAFRDLMAGVPGMTPEYLEAEFGAYGSSSLPGLPTSKAAVRKNIFPTQTELDSDNVTLDADDT